MKTSIVVSKEIKHTELYFPKDSNEEREEGKQEVESGRDDRQETDAADD